MGLVKKTLLEFFNLKVKQVLLDQRYQKNFSIIFIKTTRGPLFKGESYILMRDFQEKQVTMTLEVLVLDIRIKRIFLNANYAIFLIGMKRKKLFVFLVIV